MTDLLLTGARELGIELAERDVARLETLLDELVRWNKAYNLTSITGRDAMVTHHLLDSLAVSRFLVGERVADVGTGGGFPGLPLAIVNPRRRFTLIDAVAKKIRFVGHAARTLGLANVEPVHARVEAWDPEKPFDTVVARAFAPLPKLLALVEPLCGPGTRVLAMKGRREEGATDALAAPWRLEGVHDIDVPHLGEARHVIVVDYVAGAGSAVPTPDAPGSAG